MFYVRNAAKEEEVGSCQKAEGETKNLTTTDNRLLTDDC